MYLGGSARTWYQHDLQDLPADWASFKIKFQDLFKPKNYESIIETKLNKRKKKEEETAIDFIMMSCSYVKESIQICQKQLKFVIRCVVFSRELSND